MTSDIVKYPTFTISRTISFLKLSLGYTMPAHDSVRCSLKRSVVVPTDQHGRDVRFCVSSSVDKLQLTCVKISGDNRLFGTSHLLKTVETIFWVGDVLRLIG